MRNRFYFLDPNRLLFTMIPAKTNIAVIGTGAVGGYYGSLLQQSGCTVHFLLHHDYDYVRKHGLRVESPNGNFNLPKVKAYTDSKEIPPCNLILITLKTTANHLLPTILPPLIHKETLVLTLQNGLGGEDQTAAITGGDRILGGLCFLCSNKIGPGHIRHLDYGLITLGEYRADHQPAGITARLRQVGSLMETAGIRIQLIEDLLLARWKKLIWNIPFNGLAVVNNAMTHELMQDPETRNLCKTLMQEIANAASACARSIDPAFIEKMLRDTERMKPYAPSMKLDFDRGNPMEVESIYGTPLHIARSHGISMPETEKLYQQLLALNPAG